jgi:replicative DNA helicase
MPFQDVAAERAILAGVCRYGIDAYYDVADLVEPNSFTLDSNQIIYSCLKHIFTVEEKTTVDLASILSAARAIGVSEFLSSKTEQQHLASIIKFPVDSKNIRGFAQIVCKLDIAKKIYDQLEITREKYLHLKGHEPVSHILGIAEESIFDFMSLLNGGDENPKRLFEHIEEHLSDLADNKTDQVGIGTGFPRYDFAIGGGLRRGTVNVIGARPKIGKTLLAQNMGMNIAKKGIPVLDLDTEMMFNDFLNRTIASESQVSINDIESGKFDSNALSKNKVYNKTQAVKGVPYYHINIGGKPFEDQLAIMRRWLARHVGLRPDGTAKECVIIYDYLKLMNSADIKDVAEFQALGFMMTALHNFALKYAVPILSFIQLNRDGITKESTDAASGSDRIIWLCSNFTIYKVKSDEEIAQDGAENGNRKLVPIIARHGQGLEDKDYINVKMQGQYAHLQEGLTAKELEDGGSYVDDEEEFQNETEDVPF